MATADREPATVAARSSRFREFDPVGRPIRVFAESAGGPVRGWLHSLYGRPAYRATVEVGTCTGLAIPGGRLA